MLKDSEYDSVINNSYKIALVGMRSWAYFNVARLYGNVTILTDELHTLNSSGYQKVTREEMLNILVEELKPYIHDNTSDIAEFWVGSSINTKTLLGEIYLEQGEYEKAVEMFKNALESYGNAPAIFKVDNTYEKKKYPELFINLDDNIAEVMTGVAFSFEDGQKNILEDYFNPEFGMEVKPTNIIINNYITDVDVFRGASVNYDTIPGTIDQFYISKYSLDQTILFSADIPLYRAADLHLLLAEALNRLGQTEFALALMNNGVKNMGSVPEGYSRWTRNLGVRGRLQLAPIVVPDGVNTIEYIEDMILRERSMELAFEGKRWLDLMRVARRRGAYYLAETVAAKYTDPSLKESIRSKLYEPANWYLPTK
ncbi:MAG: RagB/SusD family nutrient uptake outer membrane protein [Bacteroidales bacterium]|nr:RagB/SusD family nutrient uptake outer membrane protein [Bacteroidales bacterium]